MLLWLLNYLVRVRWKDFSSRRQGLNTYLLYLFSSRIIKTNRTLWIKAFGLKLRKIISLEIAFCFLSKNTTKIEIHDQRLLCRHWLNSLCYLKQVLKCIVQELNFTILATLADLLFFTAIFVNLKPLKWN